jgi:hypothetical protein
VFEVCAMVYLCGVHIACSSMLCCLLPKDQGPKIPRYTLRKSRLPYRRSSGGSVDTQISIPVLQSYSYIFKPAGFDISSSDWRAGIVVFVVLWRARSPIVR